MEMGNCYECASRIQFHFRGYFCSQSCWHRFHSRARENGRPDNEIEDGPPQVEKCNRAGKHGCHVFVDKDHIFNVRWCSHACFLREQEELKGEINSLDKTRARYIAKRDLLQYDIDKQTSAIKLNESLIAKGALIRKQLDEDFYNSPEWLQLRHRVFEVHGNRCQACNCGREDGVKLSIDHVKPRSLYPALALEFSNLQVLCDVCNRGKGNISVKDWRELPKTATTLVAS